MGFGKNILLLIVAPAYGWQRIGRTSVPTQIMLSRLLYPLLALLAVTAFAPMLYGDEATLPACVQEAVILFAKFYFGYQLTSVALTVCFKDVAADADKTLRVNCAIVYNMAILVLLGIINNLLPAPWVMIQVLEFYIVYVSLKSADYLGVKRNHAYLYVLAGFVIVLPHFISYLLHLLLSVTIGV